MTRTREAMVGVVIVAAIVLTVGGTLWLRGAGFARPEQDVDAVFYRVGQIGPGNSVKFRGVEVGRVSEIMVEPNGELVRVSFELLREVQFPPDPVIILSPQSLFGDWQAEIQDRSDFPFANYPEAVGANTLPGHALPDISQLTATADRISENLSTLTERVGIAFSEETARDIASLINNVEEVTTRLSELVSQQGESFTEVTAGVQTAADEIASAAEQARSTFAGVSGILERAEIVDVLENLAEVSENMRVLSSELGGTNQELRAMAARVDTTFIGVQGLLGNLESGEGTLGRLLQDPQMAAELEGTLTELRALLEDIQENPRRYVRLSIF